MKIKDIYNNENMAFKQSTEKYIVEHLIEDLNEIIQVVDDSDQEKQRFSEENFMEYLRATALKPISKRISENLI